MPQFILTYPAGDGARIADALTTRYGYSDTLPNGDPNPQTKTEFVRQLLVAWIKREVREHEAATASATAAAAVTSVNVT